MIKKLIQILCVAFVLVLGACTSNTNTSNTTVVESNEKIVDEIKEKGYITIGCKTDVPELSYYDANTNTYSGLEIELSYQIAMEIFGVSKEEAVDYVKFVGVTVDNREECLLNKDIDLMLATFTITDERKQKYAISNGYYTSYIGMMVKNSGRDNESLGSKDITSITKLDGKYIGVPRNATTRKDFISYIESNNIKVAPIFCEYASYEELYKALMDGNIDVMSVDVSILNGYNTSKTTILKDRFGLQKYGAAALQENAKLIEVVNTAIENFQANE